MADQNVQLAKDLKSSTHVESSPLEFRGLTPEQQRLAFKADTRISDGISQFGSLISKFSEAEAEKNKRAAFLKGAARVSGINATETAKDVNDNPSSPWFKKLGFDAEQQGAEQAQLKKLQVDYERAEVQRLNDENSTEFSGMAPGNYSKYLLDNASTTLDKAKEYGLSQLDLDKLSIQLADTNNVLIGKQQLVNSSIVKSEYDFARSTSMSSSINAFNETSDPEIKNRNAHRINDLVQNNASLPHDEQVKIFTGPLLTDINKKGADSFLLKYSKSNYTEITNPDGTKEKVKWFDALSPATQQSINHSLKSFSSVKTIEDRVAYKQLMADIDSVQFVEGSTTSADLSKRSSSIPMSDSERANFEFKLTSKDTARVNNNRVAAGISTGSIAWSSITPKNKKPVLDRFRSDSMQRTFLNHRDELLQVGPVPDTYNDFRKSLREGTMNQNVLDAWDSMANHNYLIDAKNASIVDTSLGSSIQSDLTVMFDPKTRDPNKSAVAVLDGFADSYNADPINTLAYYSKIVSNATLDKLIKYQMDSEQVGSVDAYKKFDTTIPENMLNPDGTKNLELVKKVYAPILKELGEKDFDDISSAVGNHNQELSDVLGEQKGSFFGISYGDYTPTAVLSANKIKDIANLYITEGLVDNADSALEMASRRFSATHSVIDGRIYSKTRGDINSAIGTQDQQTNTAVLEAKSNAIKSGLFGDISIRPDGIKLENVSVMNDSGNFVIRDIDGNVAFSESVKLSDIGKAYNTNLKTQKRLATSRKNSWYYDEQHSPTMRDTVTEVLRNPNSDILEYLNNELSITPEKVKSLVNFVSAGEPEEVPDLTPEEIKPETRTFSTGEPEEARDLTSKVIKDTREDFEDPRNKAAFRDIKFSAGELEDRDNLIADIASVITGTSVTPDMLDAKNNNIPAEIIGKQRELNYTVEDMYQYNNAFNKLKSSSEREVMSALVNFEGLEGDATGTKPTGNLGVTSSARKEVNATSGKQNNDFEYSAKYLELQKLKWRSVPGFKSAPNEVKSVLLDIGYNTGQGTKWPELRYGLQLGGSVGNMYVAKNILDTANINDKTSKGIAKRRAIQYNHIASKYNKRLITTVAQSDDGTLTYKSMNTVIFKYTKPRHSSSKAGSITI